MKIPKNKKIIYYKDELEDEFSQAKINPIIINENYKYKHGKIWNIISIFVQNILTMPFRVFLLKLKFNYKIIGKEKFTKVNTGYFIYSNHTQAFADTSIVTLSNYPKRNFIIVNPENISMKGLKKFVELCGAIPVPRKYKI